MIIQSSLRNKGKARVSYADTLILRPYDVQSWDHNTNGENSWGIEATPQCRLNFFLPKKVFMKKFRKLKVAQELIYEWLVTVEKSITWHILMIWDCIISHDGNRI